MHDDISLTRLVIPGLTRNPVFFWIPVFLGMTSLGMINVAVDNKEIVLSGVEE
jgi:hypothetical protein